PVLAVRVAARCFFYWSYTARDPPSFPTRRSSDLVDLLVGEAVAVALGADDVHDVEGFDGGGCRLGHGVLLEVGSRPRTGRAGRGDRKSTRLNSSHVSISYAAFCLKKTTQWHERLV